MKYSVIMPTYNCEKYVEEAIKSVLCQSFSDFELIIIDDGSSDNTVATITAVISGDNRARIITKEHAGVSAARNRGIDEANGEYLLFVDGDDTWDKNLLSECDVVLSDKDILLFGILSRIYCKNGQIKELFDSGFDLCDIRDVKILNDLDHFFSSYNIASPCNKVYKREIIAKHRIRFAEECCHGEDLKFNFDYYSRISEARILRKNLYCYRIIEGNQISRRTFVEPFKNTESVCASAERFLSENKKTFASSNVIASMIFGVYCKEFSFWIRDVDKKTQIKYLKKMNQCKGYALSLKNMKGKASTLLRVLKVLNLKRAQLYLIKKRFL